MTTSLENLKKQAKTLLKNWRAGHAETLARIRAAHPHYLDARPRLADCQLVLAREAGFPSWPQMKVAVEAARKELSGRFVELACLCYDDPHYDHRSFHAKAHELLSNHSEIAEADIWAAAAAGNTAAVESFLRTAPSLVNQKDSHGWTPLICACYARVRPIEPTHSTYAAARVLLDHGADPNTCTLKSNDPPGSDRTRRFAPLTGVFGGGSTGLANQPPHPQWKELAQLLLERGANPADEQALWINPDASLELLLRHGLDARALTGAKSGGMTLLGRELSRAAIAGKADRVRLLLAHGARTDEPFSGKTPWQHAMERGNLEIAKLLEAAGAPRSDLSAVERFTALCVAGDAAGVRALLETDPDLLDRAPQSMVLKAASSGRKQAVELALDLGFDPNFVDEVAALHYAASHDHEEIVRLLLKRGASLCIRDPFYNGTPVGHADFFEKTEMRDMLLDEGPICLFDAMDYGRIDRLPDILARDPASLNRPFAECLTQAPKPQDWQTPLVRMVERGRTEWVRELLRYGANIDCRHPDGRSLLQLAHDQGYAEIVQLLESRG